MARGDSYPHHPPCFFFFHSWERGWSMSCSALLTHAEEHIVLFLLEDKRAYRPLRLCEIVQALKYNKNYCSRLLKNLTNKGVIVQCEEFGNIFYYHPINTESAERQTESAKRQTESAPVSPESILNVITLNNLTEPNSTNRDSNFSSDTQAKVPVDPTLIGDGNIPLPGGSATSGTVTPTAPNCEKNPIQSTNARQYMVGCYSLQSRGKAAIKTWNKLNPERREP